MIYKWWGVEYTHDYDNGNPRTWHLLRDDDGLPRAYLYENGANITARETRGSMQPTDRYNAVIEARVRPLTDDEQKDGIG
jgi:hypothetical protein